MTADLIERLEKAESGSRGLDAEIWYALIEKWGGHPDRDMIGRWPAYTTSLDVIVALIGEKLPGWTFANLQQADDKTWFCELREGHLTSYGAVAMSGLRLGSRPATPAIACCSALLRALSKEGEKS